jgi:EAL domain-containing protein (putative c-di-GMP-specific phosphodiesterase class I)
VAAVIGVSRRLHLRVAADGVDTQAQFDFLKQHGCDEAQGEYFGPAVDAERFTSLLSQNVDTASLRNV